MFKRFILPLTVLLLIGGAVVIGQTPKRYFPRIVTDAELTIPNVADCTTLTQQETGSVCYDTDADPDLDGTAEGQLYVYDGTAFVAVITGEGTDTPTDVDVNSDGTNDIDWDGTNMIISPLGGTSTPIRVGDTTGVIFGSGASTFDVATSNDGTYDHGIRVAAAAVSAELIHGYNTAGDHVFKLNTDDEDGGFMQLLGANEAELFEMDTEPVFYAAFGDDVQLPGDPMVSIFGDLGVQSGIDLNGDGTIDITSTAYSGLADQIDADGNGTADGIYDTSGTPQQYDWPAANASGILSNDGAGNLSWGSSSAFMMKEFTLDNISSNSSGRMGLNSAGSIQSFTVPANVTLTRAWCYSAGGLVSAGQVVFTVEKNLTNDTDLVLTLTSADLQDEDNACTANCSITTADTVTIGWDSDASWDGTNNDAICYVGMTYD